jgi:Zn-dependent protease with chaperone function
MIEPSFFYGAMYVSYALTVALAVAIFVISYLLGLGLISSLIAIIVILVALTPLTMRVSRLLYINMFVHYKKEN